MFAELLAIAPVAKIAIATAGKSTARPTPADLRKNRFTAASSLVMRSKDSSTNSQAFSGRPPAPPHPTPQCDPGPPVTHVLSRNGRDRRWHARLRIHGEGAFERVWQ